MSNSNVNPSRVCRHCSFEQHKDCCYSLDFDCQCKNEVCTEIRKKYRQKRRAMIGALAVGQNVYLLSGCYHCEGKVTKVTPEGVDVDELLHFDVNGRSYVTELPSSYDSAGWDGNGTFECGPWYIDDMPFAERTAWFEAKRKAWLEEEEARKLRDGENS
jgi:hypothetical protein